MDAISYSSFRKGMAGILDKVNDDHTPMLITRQKGKSAVIMSLEDFNSYKELAYLVSSPANSARLNQSIVEIEEAQATIIKTRKSSVK